MGDEEEEQRGRKGKGGEERRWEIGLGRTCEVVWSIGGKGRCGR